MDKQSFNQIFSCPCLYDECLISCYFKENLQELTSRVSNAVTNYLVAVVNVIPNLVVNVDKKIFVTCITHANRMLNNLVLNLSIIKLSLQIALDLILVEIKI